MGITSSTSAGVTTSTFTDVLALDFIDQKRVDTINNFDFALDIDTVDGKSKFLKLKNTKLSPYIECRTNRVLEIDDISVLFTNTATSLNEFLDLSINARYATFLIQIINPIIITHKYLILFYTKMIHGCIYSRKSKITHNTIRTGRTKRSN